MIINLKSKRVEGVLIVGKISKKSQRAFTLTEVLLAVTIVGIIAALVLPSVVTHFQDNSFNQAFERETKAIESSINGLAVNENKASFFETMMYTDTEPESYEENSEKFMKKYLRVSKICGDNNSDCFGSKYYQYQDNDKKVYTPEFKGSCASLKNGASLCITPQIGGSPITGTIDLNGMKGPNVFGKDLRQFSLAPVTRIGRNTEVAAVLELDFPPIVIGDDDVDPCEGMTCGCGTLPDCDPCEGQICGCGDLPACLPTCSTNPQDWDTTCCLINSPSITSPTHHCCTYDDFKLMTKCQNTAKAIITFDCLSMLGEACIFSGTNLPLNGGGTFTASTNLFTQEMKPEAGSFNKVIHYSTGGLINGLGASGLQFAQISGSSTDAMCHSTSTLITAEALTLELEYYVDGQGNFTGYSPSYKCY